MKFKKGDKIKLIDYTPSLALGGIYTVEDIYPEYSCVYLEEAPRHKYGRFHESRFSLHEMVKVNPFRKGDRVKLVGHTPGLSVASIYTVEDIDEQVHCVSLVEAPKKSYGSYHFSRFELVTPKTKTGEIERICFVSDDKTKTVVIKEEQISIVERNTVHSGTMISIADLKEILRIHNNNF